MKPFAIAGIQMRVAATHSNVEAMKVKLDILMNLYPWVQMVVYSELCRPAHPHGPGHRRALRYGDATHGPETRRVADSRLHLRATWR